MTQILLTKDLKERFIQTMNKTTSFAYKDGNPFAAKIEGKKFFIFLKNLSPAYFRGSEDITRIQLPASHRFEGVERNSMPFIVLGYDADNDVFVCWNPSTIITRLNAKNNVSLYSRKSLQDSAKGKKFQIEMLGNGEKIAIFKRERLSSFFNEIENIFGPLKKEVEIKKARLQEMQGVLMSIDDKALLKKIKLLLRENKMLESVEVCMLHYKGKYPAMTFNSWVSLIKDISNKG